jgi:N-acetylglucosaminyldiphosphoundecaprenol N-acetyl-beta-D-mannosaminyltransferase
LRWRSNVAFCPEVVSDLEYADSASFKTDASILMRAILVSIYGASVISMERSVEVLGVHINNLTMPETLRSIDFALSEDSQPVQIAFVNADCLNRATKNAEYREALETASLVLADGIGIRIAGSLLSRPIRHNVNGTDLFPLLCDKLNATSSRLFLLGARTAVITELCNRIRERYPHIVICGFHDGYFEDEKALVQQIAHAAPDVLLVALGAPLQETFIARNKHRLGAKICIGVGGLFDFYSGRIPRAPQWLRDAGLEWTFRLYQEPGRMWRRYLLGNIIFLARVIAERCGVSYAHATTEVLR